MRPSYIAHTPIRFLVWWRWRREWRIPVMRRISVTRSSRYYVLALSIALTAAYAYARPFILYNDSDPLTYFRKAWLFIGHAGGADVPSRGPGYPLWLILTGAASFDWWWGLVASHLVMAALMPAIVYETIRPVGSRAATLGALLFMATGLPWISMNWVMTEQLFLFVELVALMLISRWFATAKIAL